MWAVRAFMHAFATFCLLAKDCCFFLFATSPPSLLCQCLPNFFCHSPSLLSPVSSLIFTFAIFRVTHHPSCLHCFSSYSASRSAALHENKACLALDVYAFTPLQRHTCRPRVNTLPARDFEHNSQACA